MNVIAILQCPTCNKQLDVVEEDTVFLDTPVVDRCFVPYVVIFDIRRAIGAFG